MSSGYMISKYDTISILMTNDTGVDHCYVQLYELQGGKKADSFKCFGGAPNNGKICVEGSARDNVTADIIRKVFSAKMVFPWSVPVRGSNDSTQMEYVIHGVCQQAANRFLLPSYQVQKQNKDGCPRGLHNTYLFYGAYGTAFWHYQNWRKSDFDPACKKNNIPTPSQFPANCSQLFIELENHYQASIENMGSSVDDIVGTSEILFKHILPGLSEHPIPQVHRQILQERMNYITNMGFGYDNDQPETTSRLTEADIKGLIRKTNELSKQLQSELKASLGEEGFIAFNGTSTYFDITTPEFAIQAINAHS